MNEYIKNQLKSLKNIHLDGIDSKNEFYIPKIIISETFEFVVGNYYNLELKQYITNPPEGFTLHQNWNKNVIPKYNLLRCQIIQSMGKMIKIRGVAFDDLNYSWEGWLPKSSVIILGEM